MTSYENKMIYQDGEVLFTQVTLEDLMLIESGQLSFP